MTSATGRDGTASGLWTLRMLSGVHAGAEAVLDGQEETTIGSNDECDLVLEDAGLGERHIRLTVRESGVRLNVLDFDQPVFLDGRKVDDSADLEPYQVVACGLSSFALAPAGQEWPGIAAHNGHGVESGQGDDPPPGEGRHGLPTGGRASGAVNGSAKEPGATSAASGFKRRFPMHAATVAGLALAGAVVGAWLLEPKETRRGEMNADETRETIEAIAQGNNAVVEVKPAPVDGGRISVTGTVGTTRDRLRFLDELAETGIPATAQITATEDLTRIVAPILDQTLNGNRRNRVTVRTLGDSPGTLVVAGYVEKEADLIAAKAVLENDIGAQARIRYDVETRNDRIEILRRRLDGLGFEHRLHIQHVEGGVGLFGPFPAGAGKAEFIELTDRFNDEFDSRPPLTLAGNDTFLGESTMELDVRAVVLGDRERVVMRDGESYAEGTTLDNGYRIKTIEPEYIILEKPRRLGENEQGDTSNLAYFILGRNSR